MIAVVCGEKNMKKIIEKEMFYVMNDSMNGLQVRQATVFINDNRNDKDSVISKVGLHASTILRVDRKNLCELDDLLEKIRKLMKG